MSLPLHSRATVWSVSQQPQRHQAAHGVPASAPCSALSMPVFPLRLDILLVLTLRSEFPVRPQSPPLPVCAPSLHPHIRPGTLPVLHEVPGTVFLGHAVHHSSALPIAQRGFVKRPPCAQHWVHRVREEEHISGLRLCSQGVLPRKKECGCTITASRIVGTKN